MPDITKDEIDTYYGALRTNILEPSLRASTPRRFDAVKEEQALEEFKEQEDFKKDTSAIERAGTSALGALNTVTALGSITEELGERFMMLSEGGIKAAVFEDPLKEEGWSFEKNPDSRAVINERIKSMGLDVESVDARRMRSSRSSRELNLMTDRVQEKQDHSAHVKNSGAIAGELASFAGSIPDLDLVIGGAVFKPLKASASVNKARAAARMLPKGDNLYVGAKAGFLASTLNESTKYALDDSDPQEMLGTVAFGTLFGLGIGGLLPTQLGNDFVDFTATKSAARAEEKFNKEFIKGDTPTEAPTSTTEARTEVLNASRSPSTAEELDLPQTASTRLRAALDVEETVEVHAGTPTGGVGAAAVGDTPQIRVNEKSKEILDFVHGDFEADTELSDTVRNYFDFTDASRTPAVQAWQTGVQRIYEAADYLRVLPDHDKAVRTGNAPLQWLALKLTNSPIGLAAIDTADNVAVRMEESFRAQYAQYYKSNFIEWANNKGYSFTEKRILVEAEQGFNRKVQRELNARRYGESVTDDAIIKRAADDYGNTTGLMLDELKASKVEGFEDVAHDAGYFHVKHDKNKVLDWEHKVSSDSIVQSYKAGILRHSAKTGGDVTEQEAFIWATAILRHARERPGASPMSSLQTMSEDGRALIEDILRQNGVPDDRLTEAADKMLYKTAETGTVKRSRRRIGVDYSSPIIGSKEGQLFDLIDEDVFGALDSMTRGQAGEIGRVTATDGLVQKRDIGAWLDAIKDDARERGVDPTRDVEIANDILSQFSEGAFSGGLSKFTSRLNRGTTLSFMAQLGLPQLAETGILMSKGGIRGFQNHIGESVQAFLKRQPTRLVDSLAVSGEYYRPDELMGKVLNLDEVSFGDAKNMGKVVDTALDRGSRLLGEVSLFYRLQGAQQTASLKINNQFIFDSVIKDNVSQARLTSMGVNAEVIGIVRKYKDVIERNPDTGGILDNRFEQWSAADRDRWRDVIRQNIDYDVQTQRRGFGHAIAQKNDMAAISLKLKSFAMNAFFSKTLRNARLADRAAAAEVAWNLGWSSIAVGASAIINGRTDMDADQYAKRVLNWSAHISPALMMTDPISYMLGLDYISDVKSSGIQRYRGHGDGLLGLAPPLAAANNVLSIGRGVGSILDDGDLERDNINALKSVPIVGRMYGMPLLLDKFYDTLKDNNDKE